jgi:hypothetical protein
MRGGAMIVALALAMGSTAQARYLRFLRIRNVHTGVTYSGQPFGSFGIPTLGAWNRLTRLFGSHRTGMRRTVNPRLLRTLAHVAQHFHCQRLDLISGFRVPPDEHHLRSFHNLGRAALCAAAHKAAYAENTLMPSCRPFPWEDDALQDRRNA